MPTPDLLHQDGLTLDERFFARIAVKNGLISETDLALAIRERVGTGRPLPDVLKARKLLTDNQIAKVRDAQAASQVVSIDSIYADILVQKRLVARSTIEEAFAEQRRRGYKVRIGDLLVENKSLSVEGHRAVLDALLRRVSEGDGAVGETAERRGSGAEKIPDSATLPPQRLVQQEASPQRQMAKPPPPMPLPSTPKSAPPTTIPLDSASSDGDSRETTNETAVLETAPKAQGIPRTVAIDPPDAPSFLESNARILALSEEESDVPPTYAVDPAPVGLSSTEEPSAKLIASALALRLSSRADDTSQFLELDKKRVREDVTRVESALDRAVARPTSSSQASAFSPEDWVARRRTRRRLAIVGALTATLVLASAIGGAIAVGVGHHKAFDDATGLVQKTETLPPAEQAKIFAEARERLANAHGFGVSDQKWSALSVRITAGEARAAALAALAGGEPKKAQSVLQEALQRIEPDAYDEERNALSALLIQADKESLIASGREAEAARDWRTAVDCFRTANAEAEQLRVRKKMADDLHALHDAALQSRQAADRTALSSALKLYFEIWNDNVNQGLIDDVDFHLHLWSAQSLLASNRAREAIKEVQKALAIREGDPEALQLQERANKRIELDRILDRARASAREGHLEDAGNDFDAALREATGDERRQIEAELGAVKARLGERDEWEKLLKKHREVIELARGGDWDAVLSRIPDLERLKEKEAAKLRTFASRARGMVLVPSGSFEYGADDPTHDSKHLIQPKKVIDLAPFYMDACEVTNKDYAAFVRATGHATPVGWKDNLVLPNGQPAKRGDEVLKTYPTGEERHPVATITWQDAQDYARWAGKRLPTEIEWEKAARGTKGQKYPWGDKDDPPADVRINCETFVRTAAVGDSRSDVSPFKVRDMAGNVAEWCSDLFPSTDGKRHRIIRGGAFRKPVADARCYAREEGEETRAWDDVGFRCALDLSEAPSWLTEALK